MSAVGRLPGGRYCTPWAGVVREARLTFCQTTRAAVSGRAATSRTSSCSRRPLPVVKTVATSGALAVGEVPAGRRTLACPLGAGPSHLHTWIAPPTASHATRALLSSPPTAAAAAPFVWGGKAQLRVKTRRETSCPHVQANKHDSTWSLQRQSHGRRKRCRWSPSHEEDRAGGRREGVSSAAMIPPRRYCFCEDSMQYQRGNLLPDTSRFKLLQSFAVTHGRRR
jgi:hypothetical protein